MFMQQNVKVATHVETLARATDTANALIQSAASADRAHKQEVRNAERGAQMFESMVEASGRT